MTWTNHVPDELHLLEEDAHNETFLAPAGGAPVSCAAGGGAWTWGAWVEILSAAAAPADPFDFHWALLRDLSANTDYEIQIGTGAAAAEVAVSTLAAFQSAVFTQEGTQPIITPVIDGGTRVAVRVRSATGNPDTVEIKLTGHTYPPN